MLNLLLAALLHAAPPTPGAVQSLFDGVSLEGWWGCGTENPRAWMALDAEALDAKRAASLENINQHWRVEDGTIINDGRGLFLTTIDHFADFELIVEFRISPGADSGVYLRGIPQVQVWDTNESAGHWPAGADLGSGGLWNNGPRGANGRDPLVHADRAVGEWNRFHIVMIGEYVWVDLNDQRVVDGERIRHFFDAKLPIPREGPIQLQTHGGEMRWRNLTLRPIHGDEANQVLAAHRADGFTPIFNGVDFSGWAGATDQYEAGDGVIRCRAGHGGNLFTEAVYDDFEVSLEFKLPPGGNNGLAIRYPGTGDPAYTGMCELQVIDNHAPQHAGLEARQFHGSVYARVAAHRGYQRPAGEWNYQRVSVKGSHIVVELNGTRILDADTSKVEDYMTDKARFTGRDRTSGHFGFAGHGHAVEYRNIQVRH